MRLRIRNAFRSTGTGGQVLDGSNPNACIAAPNCAGCGPDDAQVCITVVIKCTVLCSISYGNSFRLTSMVKYVMFILCRYKYGVPI
jgi:hypothetical protein